MAVHISPVRIQRIKERWEREVLYGLSRQERRLGRPREALAHILAPRRRDHDGRFPEPVLPFRPTPPRDGQLERFVTAKRALRLARGSGTMRQWLLFGRRGNRWEQDPEKAVRRPVFRLASRAMPQPLRDLLWLSRTLRGTGVRQR